MHLNDEITLTKRRFYEEYKVKKIMNIILCLLISRVRWLEYVTIISPKQQIHKLKKNSNKTVMYSGMMWWNGLKVYWIDKTINSVWW